MSCGGTVTSPERHLDYSYLAMAPKRSLAVASSIILAALMTSCSSGQTGVGPFGPTPSASDLQCDPATPGQVWTFADDEVRNHAQATATIDSVDLANPRGLKTLGAWAVRVTGRILYGAMPGEPPKYDPRGFDWPQRRAAAGALVPHTSSDNDVTNLVLVVRLTGKRGTADGLDVWYHVGSQHYQLRTAVHYLLTARC